MQRIERMESVEKRTGVSVQGADLLLTAGLPRPVLVIIGGRPFSVQRKLLLLALLALHDQRVLHVGNAVDAASDVERALYIGRRIDKAA